MRCFRFADGRAGTGPFAALGIGFLRPGVCARPRRQRNRGRSHPEKTEEAFQNGDYDTAADLYDQAIRLDPNRVEAFVKRASLYFRQRKYTEAIDLLTRAEKLSVSDLSVKTALGSRCTKADRKIGDWLSRRSGQAATGNARRAVPNRQALCPRKSAARDSRPEQYFRYRPEEDKRNDWEAQLLLGTAYYLTGKLTDSQNCSNKRKSHGPKTTRSGRCWGRS